MCKVFLAGLDYCNPTTEGEKEKSTLFTFSLELVFLLTYKKVIFTTGFYDCKYEKRKNCISTELRRGF